jgi:SH3-like domain-containing protein
MRLPRIVALALGSVLVLFAPARAGDAAASAVPRFASLASDKVYMREGPTYRHPILWIYRRRGWPVEVVQQYDVWRRVRDADGTTGWVHASMIAERRTVLVTAKRPVAVRRSSDPRSPILALAQGGVVAKLITCLPAACEIDVAGTEGWIEKKNIWGVNPREVFQ